MIRAGLAACVGCMWIVAMYLGAMADHYVRAPYAVRVVDDGCIGISAPIKHRSSWEVATNGR